MARQAVLCLTVAVAVVMGGLSLAEDKSCGELMRRAEEVWLGQDYSGSDKVLAEARKICPRRAEIYWRIARNEYDRIEDLPRGQRPEKEALIERYRGIEALAEKCMELDPADGDCYFWKGVGMGRRGTTQGILSSLDEAKDLEEIFLKAEKLQPQYRSANGAANTLGDIYNALGQFYRVVPEWLCMFPFKRMVGTCGDLDKSVEYNRKAVLREPKRIEYHKELAVSLLCRGRKKDRPADIEEGKKVFAVMLSLPEVKKTDPIDKEHARQILANPKLACGYSRDAQQEQGKDEYKK